MILADVVLLGLLLAATVCGEIKVPVLGVGVQNVLLPACGLGLALRHRTGFRALVTRHRALLGLCAALLAWTFVAAAASPARPLALRTAVKAATFAPLFVGFLALCSVPARARLALRTLFGFLLLLAAGGVLEALVPDAGMWRLFRSADSLAIQPRIASFMPWPNPFGVTMVGGVALAAALAFRGWLAPGAALAAQLFFLTQVAQSGSRNAWGTLGVTLVVLGLWRVLKIWQVAALALVFGGALLLFPVAAWQAGLKEKVPVIEVMVPEGARESLSIAPARLSLSMREQLWAAAKVHVLQRPIVGLGPGVFSVAVSQEVLGKVGFNTHSLPLNLLVELGVPGLLLAGLALLAAWGGRDPRPGPAGPSLVPLLVGQGIDCFLYDPTSVTVALLLVAALASGREE